MFPPLQSLCLCRWSVVFLKGFFLTWFSKLTFVFAGKETVMGRALSSHSRWWRMCLVCNHKHITFTMILVKPSSARLTSGWQLCFLKCCFLKVFKHDGSNLPNCYIYKLVKYTRNFLRHQKKYCNNVVYTWWKFTVQIKVLYCKKNCFCNWEEGL